MKFILQHFNIILWGLLITIWIAHAILRNYGVHFDSSFLTVPLVVLWFIWMLKSRPRE